MRHIIIVITALVALLAAPASARAEDALSPDAAHSPSYYGGVALSSVGGLGAAGGLISYFVLSAATDSCAQREGCRDEYKTGKTASVVALVLGGASLAVGIPLVLSAADSPLAKNKRDKKRRAKGTPPAVSALKPTVRVGAASASATWTF
jgi:hypothetical protein